MTTLTLRELAEEAIALEALVDIETGEWTDEHEALAQQLAAKLATKGDAYGDYLHDQQTRAAALKAEEQRLANKRKAIEAGIERLSRYAAQALQAMDRPKVEGERWTVALTKHPPRVVLDETAMPDTLPPGFVRVVPERREPDLVAIKEALKLGESLEWARLEQTYTVRVR